MVPLVKDSAVWWWDKWCLVLLVKRLKNLRWALVTVVKSVFSEDEALGVGGSRRVRCWGGGWEGIRGDGAVSRR